MQGEIVKKAHPNLYMYLFFEKMSMRWWWWCCLYLYFTSISNKRYWKWWREREVVKMFMTFGFLVFIIFFSSGSQCAVPLWCLLLLYPLNFEGAYNQFTPFYILNPCDGSSTMRCCVVLNKRESLYNYYLWMEMMRMEGRQAESFGICHHKIKVVKIKINKFIVFFAVAAAAAASPDHSIHARVHICEFFFFWIKLIFWFRFCLMVDASQRWK